MRGTSVLSCLVGTGCLCAMVALVPPARAPVENPITDEKRVLGKMLFWDEQLSSDNTIACGTCHIPAAAGADPRLAQHPGFDGEFDTDDDVTGSFGVMRADAAGDYQPDEIFEFQRQVTGRASQPFFHVSHEPSLFWDGRALNEFVDPETGDILIPDIGAMESQAVGPIMSTVEMAQEGRTWDEVAAKLAAVRPMALATDLPSDIDAAIAASPSYPELFANAFGDEEISAWRIAFAIATYERTLMPDQTPWDRFDAGDDDALTARQKEGLEAFDSTACAECHIGAFFARHDFTNIGVRPWEEDPGRMIVTENFDDRGKFKIPSLRNVGLKPTFMHNGQRTSLRDAVNLYRFDEEQFRDNIDRRMINIRLPQSKLVPVLDFLRNGLTDPRVANEQFPFDRPKLHSESATPNPMVFEQGRAGSGGHIPQMIAAVPPNIGNSSFKIGVHNALGGADAYVAMSSSPPVNGELDPDRLFGPFELAGSQPGEGYDTWHWPIPDDLDLKGGIVYLQWFIDDPQAPQGRALSPVAQLTYFCNNCPDPTVTLDDVQVVFGALESGGIEQLTVSDDDRMVVQSRPWHEIGEPNRLDVVIGATTAVEQPAMLDLLVEARLDTPGGEARIRLRNWNTGQFDEIHTYAIGQSEQVVQVTDIDAGPYVRESDGRIELSYKNVVFASFVIGFRTSIDHVEITVRD